MGIWGTRKHLGGGGIDSVSLGGVEVVYDLWSLCLKLCIIQHVFIVSKTDWLLIIWLHGLKPLCGKACVAK